MDTNSFDSFTLAQLMKISDVRPSSLQAWLEKRVHYVVDDGFDLNGRSTTNGKMVQYSYPTEIPDALKEKLPDSQSIGSTATPGLMMSNLSASIYFMGKQRQYVILLDLPGIGNIPVTSPRMGLLEIGPALFPDLHGYHAQNIYLDICRVSTLFHEARHGDGHGVTLGFMHAKCPAGKDYAGLNVCDAAANGPYTIQASLHKNMMNSCGAACTEKTKRALQLVYYDIADRTLSDAQLPDASVGARAGDNWDDAPESVQ
jgi:hypothetical protein